MTFYVSIWHFLCFYLTDILRVTKSLVAYLVSLIGIILYLGITDSVLTDATLIHLITSDRSYKFTSVSFVFVCLLLQSFSKVGTKGFSDLFNHLISLTFNSIVSIKAQNQRGTISFYSFQFPH